MASVSEYIVKAGDTLSELAMKFGTTVSNLVNWNNITDANFIVVGQKLDVDGTGTSSSNTSKLSSRAVIKVFGLQSGTDRTIYATWNWDKSHTDNYKVRWWYLTKDNIWFIGTETTVDFAQATYNAPNNAIQVKFHVKPIATTREVNGKETAYWTADWSTEQIYDFANNPPTTPTIPDVEIDKYKLTARLNNLNVNGTHIQFQIVKDDAKIFNTGVAAISYGAVSYSCTVDAGSKYKVRCRSIRENSYSEWTEYSSNADTIPAVPKEITECKAKTETSVYLEWTNVKNASQYDLEYTTKKEYFDVSDETTTVSGIEGTRYEKTGLESGEEYFFRVRAVNDAGESGWSDIVSTKIGKAPAAPTTWSSTTTAIVGEPLKLYWVHNAEDNSSQTTAELELYINGTKDIRTITNDREDDEKDKTSVYEINTSVYVEGTQFLWRVRTAGVTGKYGDWSIQRTVDVYAPPTVNLVVTDKDGELLESLTTFPFCIDASAGPATQNPIGYHVVVSAKEAYETVDYAGNFKMVNAGEEVYSKHFDIAEALTTRLSASDLNLQNNITYTVKCTVSMNSGLTAEATQEFKVAWTDDEYQPNAEIGIDLETLTAQIRPFCQDENGVMVEDVILSVYRREFNGSFTEIATGLKNLDNTFITDPHPALDYARYRVVALTESTGAITYFDVPGYVVGESAIIIQWDEAWSNFDTVGDAPIVERTWTGSMLRLPYNVDVADSSSPDVTHAEYIGRENPVSYYGTQRGFTSSWSVEIEKSDIETLYALRRLQNWMGDVYVREPSGTGYWATITVSFSQKHLDLTIPVNLNIVRVEGGV